MYAKLFNGHCRCSEKENEIKKKKLQLSVAGKVTQE